MEKPAVVKRSAVIRAIHMQILKSIYQRQEEIKLNKMGDIAVENQILLGSKYCCFMFYGNWYTFPPNSPIPDNGKGVGRRLSPLLTTKAIDIIKNDTFDSKAQKDSLYTTIGNILTLCKHSDDLKALLPYSVFAILPEIPEEIFNVAEPLKQLEVEEILSKNEAGLNLLKQLYMMELLLAKV